MNTPTEEQIMSALALSKEKTRLTKELERIQKALVVIDGRILKALGAAEGIPKQGSGAKTKTTAPTAAAAAATAKAKPEAKQKEQAPKPKAEATPAKEKPAKPPKEPKTKKADKADKAEKPASDRPRAKRGQLSKEILDMLKANPEGVRVEELARALGREQSHIYVWNANIGKKIPGVSSQKGLLMFKEPETEKGTPGEDELKLD